jgi:hypothetical protein
MSIEAATRIETAMSLESGVLTGLGKKSIAL